MITINVKGSSVEISGHAGHSPIGTDIVCAGISALYQTLVESAMELTNGTYTTSSEAGYGYIKPNGYVSGEYKLLVRSFLIGINGIASSYPDFIKVITN